MARGRDIKPGFFISDEMAEVSRDARLLFIGLWTLADREGRLELRPARIKAQLFPYDSDIDQDRIGEMVDELANCAGRFLTVYIVGHNSYIQIKNFKKHQHIHPNEKDSEIPSPGADGSRSLVAQTRTYFIQAGEGGNIKIGRTTNLRSRIANLQIGIPARLKLIRVVDSDIERACHEKFHHLKVDGEWFTPDAELIDFIEHLKIPVITGQATESSGNSALPSVPSSLHPVCLSESSLSARDPSVTTTEHVAQSDTVPFRWLDTFKSAHQKAHNGSFYGRGEQDAKACGKLLDLLTEMPVSERIDAWNRRDAIIAEFLTDGSPRLVNVGHSFAFFVEAFSALRIPIGNRPKQTQASERCDGNKNGPKPFRWPELKVPQSRKVATP